MLRFPVGPPLVGMVLARPVLDYQSHVLLAAGVVLNPHYLRRLEELGYREVYVDHALAADAVEPELLPESVQRQALDTMRATMRTAVCGRDLPLGRIESLVDLIAREIASNEGLLTGLTLLKGADNYTFLHSAQVCALSMLLGTWLGMRGALLRDLGVGALLHDVGKAFIPVDLLRKADPLTADELATVRRHAELGCQALGEMKGLSRRVPLAVCEHHERMDGSGYPRGLLGTEISLPGRITAVADSYDAMTSSPPYRKGKLPHRACEELAAQTGTWYEPHVVDTFLTHVAVYPLGSFLQLADGSIGICVRQGKTAMYPVVRLATNPEGRRLTGKAFEVTVNSDPTRVVIDVLQPEAALQLLND